MKSPGAWIPMVVKIFREVVGRAMSWILLSECESNSTETVVVALPNFPPMIDCIWCNFAQILSGFAVRKFPFHD